MASTAINAQGTVFQISTGTGGAKTITAAALGYPTILTSTSHGFSAGDVITISGATGLTTLNGSWTVLYKTTSTLAVGLDSTGGSAMGGTVSATPTTYTAVSNVKSFNGFAGTATEIDVTNLSSLAKEYRLGLQDFGSITLEMNPDFSDAGQNALRAAQADPQLSPNFKLLFPNGKTASFAGYVKATPISGGVDAVVDGSVEIRISGLVTIA